jgi:hypothetical protein
VQQANSGDGDGFDATQDAEPATDSFMIPEEVASPVEIELEPLPDLISESQERKVTAPGKFGDDLDLPEFVR